MIKINNTPFQNEICAYRLATEALYHRMPPPTTILPGEAFYEITQIFLQRVQTLAETKRYDQSEKNDPSRKFFSQNLSFRAQSKLPAYPVEVLFCSYAAQDKTKRSTISHYYSWIKGQIPQELINQARELTDSLKGFEQVLQNPKNEGACFERFDRSWFHFLRNLNERLSDGMKTSCIIEKKSQTLEPYADKYQECFDELCKTIERRGPCRDFAEFLNEWKTLSEGEKDTARNDDSFVQAFQKTLNKIRKLSKSSFT